MCVNTYVSVYNDDVNVVDVVFSNRELAYEAALFLLPYWHTVAPVLFSLKLLMLERIDFIGGS